MARSTIAAHIEQQLAERAGLFVTVDEDEGSIILGGKVESAEARQAAEDIARRLAPGQRIQNDIELPELEEEQELIDRVLGTSGAPIPEPGEDQGIDETEDEAPCFPPTDPVVTTTAHGGIEVLGGFTPTSMDSIEVEPSAEDLFPGDEALAEAIRRELREDAATTDLDVDVTVRHRVAYLRGRVRGPEDAENAEEVAGRVPGLREVVDELEIG